MDARDRIVNSRPTDFLHRIASVVPGYEGYTDRERRRDADKLLRTELARRFTEQRERLTRVQQGMARSHQTQYIAEVDRITGVLQRFIDRLSTATYGYTGLFDPIKVEAADLDQLHAFDMSLTSGADQLSAAISGLEAASGNPLAVPGALNQVASTVDDLNQRFNQRADLLTSGTRLPDNDYQSMLNKLDDKTSTYPGSTMAGGTVAGAPSQASSPTTSGGEAARVGSSGAGVGSLGGGSESAGVATPPGGSDAGIPTTNLSMSGQTPDVPGMGSLVGGNQGFAEMPDGGMQGIGQGPIPVTDTGETAGSTAGVETASSPVSQPGAPGHDLVDGLSMAPGPADVNLDPINLSSGPNIDKGLGGMGGSLGTDDTGAGTSTTR